MTVEFKYELGEWVYTPFDEPGIVIMLGFDKEGVTYYVKTKAQESWYLEEHLTKKESEDNK